MRVEQQVLQVRKHCHRQVLLLMVRLAAPLAGHSVADSHTHQLEDDGLTDAPSDQVVLEQPVQVVDVVFVRYLPPLLTEEGNVGLLLGCLLVERFGDGHLTGERRAVGATLGLMLKVSE